MSEIENLIAKSGGDAPGSILFFALSHFQRSSRTRNYPFNFHDILLFADNEGQLSVAALVFVADFRIGIFGSPGRRESSHVVTSPT
jgi:hypothetical protein